MFALRSAPRVVCHRLSSSACVCRVCSNLLCRLLCLSLRTGNVALSRIRVSSDLAADNCSRDGDTIRRRLGRWWTAFEKWLHTQTWNSSGTVFALRSAPRVVCHRLSSSACVCVPCVQQPLVNGRLLCLSLRTGNVARSRIRVSSDLAADNCSRNGDTTRRRLGRWWTAFEKWLHTQTWNSSGTVFALRSAPRVVCHRLSSSACVCRVCSKLLYAVVCCVCLCGRGTLRCHVSESVRTSPQTTARATVTP